MAKKSELEAAHLRRDRIDRDSEALEWAGDYRGAVQRAVTAIPDFADSLAFQRRFMKCEPRLPEIDRILRLAPAVFAHEPLTRLREYCDGRKKPDREAMPGLADRIRLARENLGLAVRVWSSLTQTHGTECFHEAPPAVQMLLETWRRMGAVSNPLAAEPTRYRLTTQLHRPVRAKCSTCGREGRAAAEKLLEPRTCPACKQRNGFVILARDT